MAVVSIICIRLTVQLAQAGGRENARVRARNHACKEGRRGDGARAAGAGGVPLTLVKAGTRSYHECEALIAITGVT